MIPTLLKFAIRRSTITKNPLDFDKTDIMAMIYTVLEGHFTQDIHVSEFMVNVTIYRDCPRDVTPPWSHLMSWHEDNHVLTEVQMMCVMHVRVGDWGWGWGWGGGCGGGDEGVGMVIEPWIVLFHNYFPIAVGMLAYKSEQPTNGCITMFHKYCCYMKHGGITTNYNNAGIWSMG